MDEFIYIRTNDWWKSKQLIKLGQSDKPIQREGNYITCEPDRGEFLKIYKVNKSDDSESKLQTYFKQYHYNENGGNEFYNECITDKIEGALTELNIEYELVPLYNTPPRPPRTPPISPPSSPGEPEPEPESSFTMGWQSRPYQKDIIDYGYEILMTLFVFYLELATGGGKTFIVFNILKKILPDTIVIFSPRKNINEQNIKKKYLSLLKDDYEVFDNNLGESFKTFYKNSKKRIIVACIQSYKTIYEYLNKYNIKDSFVWFDEAHWGIERWLSDGLNEIQEYILKSSDIKYRIFTSASPNPNIVEQNELILGKLYKPICIQKLIEAHYLCNIIPYVFEVEEYSVDYCNTILKDFKDYKRNWGLSFHNFCKNAFNMFYKHYEIYTRNETTIKPYLIISITKEILNDKRYKKIELDYNYNNINDYESNINRIAYVVKQTDMGYDFEKIDYISLTDRKMSIADLIQCNGRGLRPDKLGLNGTNKDKKLHLMIPYYIDEDTVDKYDNLISVLQYLQYDIGLEWNDIKFKEKKGKKNAKRNSSKNYDGERTIQSKILDTFRYKKINWTIKKLLIRCKNNDIHCNKDYYEYKEKYPLLTLPDIIPNGFNWCDTYINSPYYSKKECKDVIKNIIDSNSELEDIEDHDVILDKLNEIDSKIPNICLWSFYGGNQGEYLVFN